MNIVQAAEKFLRETVTDDTIIRHHLRTRDWLLKLEPGAGKAVQVAALLHDIERWVEEYKDVDNRP